MSIPGQDRLRHRWLNEHFKGVFDSHGQVSTKGLINTRRLALRAKFVY